MSKGLSIECEVGGIGGEEDGVVSAGELADPRGMQNNWLILGVDYLSCWYR